MRFQVGLNVLLLAVWLSIATVFCEQEAEIEADYKLSEADKKTIEDSKQKFEFQAEKTRVMKIIVNSLYKNKDIFLRELISNAQDALSKAHIESLKNASYLNSHNDLGIWIKYNTQDRTLLIRDSGIGMTRDDLIKNLGTIAKSGTNEFLDKIKKAQDQNVGSSELDTLVGQFGVGFYSAFLVADKVTVVSKNNDDDQYIWESDSESFSVVKDPRGDTLGRGTAITLHLKSHGSEYLDYKKLEELVTKYSQFISYKILVAEEKEEKVKSTEEEGEPKEKSETDEVEDDAGSEGDAGKETEGKTKTTYTYHHLNKVKPVWLRDPSNVTDSEYLALYQTLVGDKNSRYLLKIHFVGEGNVRFRALLFVPEVPPAPESYRDEDKFLDRVKLYVKRVYIKSALSTIFPRYFHYMAGVIDSDDLPLNVARESIQHGKLMDVIKKKVVKKVIQNFLTLPEDVYPSFYGNYSNAIKSAITIDKANRNSLIKLLRFPSSYTVKKELNMTSIDEYIERQPANRTQILYITCKKMSECEDSPLATPLVKRGYEVLYLVDPIDDYVMNHAHEYEMMKFQSVSQQGVKLDEKSDSPEFTEMFATASRDYHRVLEFWTQNSRFKKYVGSANISLDMEHACVLVADQYGFTGNMERIFRSQAKHYGATSSYVQDALRKKKHIIINVHHPVIKAMQEQIEEGKTEKDDELNDLARTCYAVALLNGGYSMSDLNKIATIMENNAIRALGHTPKLVREEIHEEIEKVNKIRFPSREDDDDDDDDDEEDDSDDDDKKSKNESESYGGEDKKQASSTEDAADPSLADSENKKETQTSPAPSGKENERDEL